MYLYADDSLTVLPLDFTVLRAAAGSAGSAARR